MASEQAPHDSKPPMTVAELVAYTKKELDADAERQAKVSAAGAVGDLQGQTGATLDLSSKNINALPVEVIALIKDKVERLALSHNPQVAVPTQIVQCDRLRYLNIRWNQLTDFPDAVLQLSALEILDVSKNRIVSIPEGIKDMTSLKFLAVARNRITRLPLALGYMPSLHKLKFDENPIVFPPPDELQAVNNHIKSSNDAEREKDVCHQVKRFLKAAALRERLKAPSEEELSESNVETPRPPKRTLTGRFPVRPSISGIDTMDDKSKSPNDAPPIPLRSHARNLSVNAPVLKRPGIAPLLTGANDNNRSRSETVSTSGSIRSRRQGVVAPRKTSLAQSSVLNTAIPDLDGKASSRSSMASTIKPTHNRATSSVSTTNGFLTASSGGETSSGAVSPIDSPITRYGPSRRLSSLPENRNSKVQISEVVRAAKRLLFCIFQLQGPFSEVAQALKDGTPKRSVLDRPLFTANAHVGELDRLLTRMESTFEDDHGKSDDKALHEMVVASVAALEAYGYISKKLKRHTQRLIELTDPFYVRCLMSQIYMAMVECRNICTILGFKCKPSAPRGTSRVLRASGWSSRTVTPTQSKPMTSRRIRGGTIVQGMGSSTALRAMAPPPVPLNGSSRPNTLASMIAAPTPLTGAAPSRSNTMTMRSIPDDADYDEQFDRIYLKLQSACELASQSLPDCGTEFRARKDNADAIGQTRSAHHWALALSKCDEVINANNLLIARLKSVRLKDPGVRNQRDFWQLCDSFVQAWTDLAMEIKDISTQRVDITTVKTVMRPVQKAVKEVSKTISESPLYQQAVRQAGESTSSLAPPFPPANINTTFAQAVGQNNGLHSGFVTPVPAAPLSAALGPAVQATTASASYPEYFQHGAQLSHGGRAGLDSTVQQAGHGRNERTKSQGKN